MRDVTDPERSSEPTEVGYSPNCWFILFTAKQKNILFTKGGERGNEKKQKTKTRAFSAPSGAGRKRDIHTWSNL